MKTRSIVCLAGVSAPTALRSALQRFRARHLLALTLLVAGLLNLFSGEILATPITPPSQATLLFSTSTDSLPAAGVATGAWAQYLPSGGPSFAAIGAPTVKQFGGVKWALNARFNAGGYLPGDGYRVGQYAAPIPCNGVSIVVAVKPTRNASFDDWNSVTDIFYNRLVLGLGNVDGRVKIIRNGTITQLPANTAIPDGQITILSLVVQASGTYKVYANGSLIYSDATLSTMTALNPAWNGGNTGFWSYITLGRNYPDGWSVFNGLLGDTFVYTSALSDAERQALEAALTEKFITNATLSYTITVTAGANGSISPSGATLVLQGADKSFTITPNGTSVVEDVLIDGVSVGPATSYTFTSVQTDHTIAATFVAFPDQTIGASAGPNGTINPGGIVTVSPGGTDKTFTITPNLGYKVADVVVDGASLGEKYSYTFTRVSDSTHTIAATFAPLGRNIPRADQLLFSAVTESFSGNEPSATGNWASFVPAGRTFTAIATPTVKQFGGVKWEKNERADLDGYLVGQYATAIPCSGASIVVAVKPKRNTSVDSWNSVIDIFYNRLVLALGNSDGRLWIMRNGITTQLPATSAIPDGQITILSLVVQANGTYKIYVNGSMIYSVASTSAMTSLDPKWLGGTTGYWSYINIGRNTPDPWSVFNGHIGDVFVYTSALSDSDRQTLEADLTAKFITHATLSYTITASAGANGSVSPSGATQVLQGADKTFAITPNGTSVVGNVLIDGVSVGPVTSYTFTNVQTAHTIAATFVGIPDQTITASAGANGTINPSGVVTVSPGGTDKTFTITPDPGYKVANVMVDGASQGEKYSYTFARVSNSLHTIAVTFAPLGRSIPRSDQLLFSSVTESFAGNEPSATGNWASYVPGGQTFSTIGTPTVKQSGGVKWEKNDYADGDGYRVGQYAAAIPCNGASIVVAVKPTRNGIGSDFQWNSVTDIFYNRLVLALSNADGRVRVMRNGIDNQLPAETAIPDGQATILSLVVQVDGTYKVYANGKEILSNTATSAMTTLDPKWQGGATGYWSYINIGRNNPDPWSVFNGQIGDMFVYASALSDSDRQMLEADLMAKFVTNTPGTNILSFGLPGNPAVIDQLAQAITLTLPSVTDVTALAPTYTVSPLATGNPISGAVRNFTTPQTYTVTAANGSTKDYTVRVLVEPHLTVTNGLALWLDASQLAGLNAGQQVETWTDMSGQNNHAIRQAGSSAGYPKYVTRELNGKPVLRFNSQNAANGDSFRFNRISTIRTVFWVVKENSNLDMDPFLLGDDSAYHFHRGGINGPLWTGYTSQYIRGGTTKLMGTVVDGTTTPLPSDKFQLISLVTTDSVQANQITQDRTYHGSWVGDIAEILIYTRALSTDEEGAIGSYLADKYALATTYEPSTPQAKILTFGPPDNPAVIDQAARTIAWTVPYGTPVTSLAPTFTLSAGAICAPVSGTSRDFSSPLSYTVTASDLATRTYTVTVTVAPMSPAKEILTFGPGAVIGSNNIAWSVPFGTDLSNLAPVYTVSSLATGNPASGIARDFTTPQSYTITAQNGTTMVYTVTTTMLPDPNPALRGHWVSGDPTLNDTSGFTPAGTHDGVAEGPNAASLAYSSDVPAGFTGVALDLTAGGAGVTINNSKIFDKGYLSTFDDPILSKFTISFWAKGFPRSAWWAPWVSKHGEGSEGWQIRRFADSSNPTFTIRGIGNDDPITTIETNDTTWHHYAGVFDGVAGTRKLYVDGVDYLGLTGLYGAVGNPNKYRLELGARDGGNFFDGLLFDVRIYSVALEACEVHVVMTTPTTRVARANIHNFGLPGNPAVINQDAKTILLTVPYGTNVTALAPSFTTSYGATCDRASGTAYDFTTPLHYIVTSPDAAVTRDYTVTVTVATQPPTVTTGAASGITGTSVTLNGTVNPNGVATSARFEYGLTPGYGSTASVTLSPSNGTTAQNVSVSISGLQAAQIYHYRLSATNSGGTSPGADMTFALAGAPPVPGGFALIPSYGFSMGDPLGEGDPDEVPVHTVQVGAFHLAKYQVTKALWDEVRTWGGSHGYTDLALGAGKAATHPVQAVTWYDVVKWCNARSEKEGLPPCYRVAGAVCRTGTNDAVACDWTVNGYRLPTEAEWEKAARDGRSGQRFPWGEIITHSQANYSSDTSRSYDMSPTQGFHPAYNDGVYPYTSPVGSFPASGYGLYDMTGNVFEWCWDWYGGFPSTSQTDPRGAASGSWRVLKGCGWWGSAYYCRIAYRHGTYPSDAAFDFGFRLARSVVQLPVVTTGAADGITETLATLHGTVNPNGFITTAQFEYGPSASYGSTASVALAPNNGTASQYVSASISGLMPGTTYHYRLTAANSKGTSMGEDMMLATEMILGSFKFKITDGKITITAYLGTGGEVDIPGTINGMPVIGIGDYAFISCASLTGVTIPDSVTRIGEEAFEDCPNLTRVTLGNSVTRIGMGAFYLCTGLSAVTLPASVASIGDYAFGECYNLTRAGFMGNAPAMGEEVFFLADGDFAIYYFSGGTGFTSPTWLGYPAIGIGGAAPEIVVEQPVGTNLTGGSASINCGSINIGDSSSAIAFTVKNTGTADLAGLAVTKNGTNAGDFSISAVGATTLTPGAVTTFSVTFTPGTAGPRNATLHIVSNDADENPFDIILTGTGTASSAKDILTFVFAGLPAPTMAGTDISQTVPYGTNVTNLAPAYTVSGGATGSPATGTARNFTSPQTYTVSAMDGTSKVYTVTVTVAAPVPVLPVTNGLIVWLEADAVNTGDANQVRVVGSNTFVKRWNDQSGNSHYATNASEGEQPKFIAGALNGRPTLRFTQINDSTGSKLYLGDLSGHFPSAGSLFAVSTINNDGRYNLFGNRDNDERWVADTWDETQPGVFRVWRTDLGTNPYSSWPQTGSHVFAMESSNSVYRFVVDGTQIGSIDGDYHNGSGTDWTIGDSASGNGQQLNGDIAEMILFNRVLAPAEADKIGGYLAEKYGLTTHYPPLDATVPYWLTATGGDAKVDLAWAAFPGATGYKVKRSPTSGGPYSEIGAPSGTSFTDPSVSNQTTYFYVVSAMTGTVESDHSAEVSATATPVDGAVSTMTASLPSLWADGFDFSTITVTLKNAGGTPVAGKTVTLVSDRASGVDTIAGSPGTSNASGVVTFTVKSSTVGAAVFTATDTTDGLALTSTIPVTFVPLPTPVTAYIPNTTVLNTWDFHGSTAAGWNLLRNTFLTDSGVKLGAPIPANPDRGTWVGMMLHSAPAGLSYVNSGVEMKYNAPDGPPPTFAFEFLAMWHNDPRTGFTVWADSLAGPGKTGTQEGGFVNWPAPATNGGLAGPHTLALVRLANHTVETYLDGVKVSTFACADPTTALEYISVGFDVTANMYMPLGSIVSQIRAFNVASDSPDKDILSFVFPGLPATTIAGTNIRVAVPFGTVLTNLAPTYTVSPLAQGNPASGTARNFSTPQTYTVTAQDGSTKVYTVTVAPAAPSGMIHVNIDTATRTGLVGPAGGAGQIWNTFTRTGGSALLDAGGLATTVGFTTSAGYQDPWGSPALTLLTSGAFAWYATQSYNLTLSGLTAGGKYDLYLASYYPNEQGCKGTFATTNATSTVGAQQIDNRVINGAGGNSTTWVRGNNYVLFQNVMPDASRKIIITMVGSTGDFDRRVMLNGFQLVRVNAPPVFSGYALSGTADKALSIYPAKILAQASDPDGDALSLSRVIGPSAQGGTVSLTSFVNYTPPAGFVGTDTFEVELTDARGASTRGTVTITLADAAAREAALGLNLTRFAIQGGKVDMVFRGIPGRSYTIQRSTDMITWSDLATVTSGPDGKVPFTDPSPPVPQGFYRTRSN